MQKSQGLPDNEYLVSSEVMELAKISRRTLERYVADGKLPSAKLGGFGSRRYLRADVDSLLRGEISPSTPTVRPVDDLPPVSAGRALSSSPPGQEVA